VAVINETLARMFFGGRDPIGRRITAQNHSAEIVGIAADVRPYRPNEPVAPQIYWPIQQYRRGAAYLVIRTAPGMTGVERAVKARAAVVNADIQLGAFRTIDEQLGRRLVSPRFNMLLVASFAAVAVLMAAVGVYGVNAYAVAKRTREFGVRAALGAAPAQLVSSVVRRGMVVASAGIAGGFVGALVLGRVLEGLLYGLPPRDPLTLVMSIAVLTAVAAMACWLPARRASRIDPIVALRVD
jgi:hypothetical protein